MHRQTARKYVEAGELPSTMTAPRDWRTRTDPFEEHWPDIEARLRATPGLEAKTLFELLEEVHPGRYAPGQLRTLQRHVKRWRAAHGPEREVVIAQRHRPGEAAQTDIAQLAWRFLPVRQSHFRRARTGSAGSWVRRLSFSKNKLRCLDNLA